MVGRLLAVNPTWLPFGNVRNEALDWDRVGRWAVLTLDTFGDLLKHTGIGWLVFLLFMAGVTIGLLRIFTHKL